MKVSYRPAKFDGRRHCGSGDIMILVFHVILQNQVFKGSCDFMDRSTSRQVTILLSLVTLEPLIWEI